MLGIETVISTIGAGNDWKTAVEQGFLITMLKFETMLWESAAIAAVRV